MVSIFARRENSTAKKLTQKTNIDIIMSFFSREVVVLKIIEKKKRSQLRIREIIIMHHIERIYMIFNNE